MHPHGRKLYLLPEAVCVGRRWAEEWVEWRGIEGMGAVGWGGGLLEYKNSRAMPMSRFRLSFSELDHRFIDVLSKQQQQQQQQNQKKKKIVFVCVCVRACVRACVCLSYACVCVCE